MTIRLLVLLGLLCGIEAQTCIYGEVRLVGGSTENEGRVEICYNGVWGTVCDNSWNSNDAKVVCRQLGYDVDATGAAYSARCCAEFGQGSGPIHFGYMYCSGTQCSLLQCSRSTYIASCDHSEDAGVVCPPTVVNSNCNYGEVRLVGGSTENEGRVELCYNGVWGTVCDKSWDSSDAKVVCRQLGYQLDTYSSTSEASFGQGSGPIHFEYVHCSSTQYALLQCYSYNSNYYTCYHSEDAGVVCSQNRDEREVRLINGLTSLEGTVEVYLDNAWRGVCDDSWDYRDAFVVCRQLGYPATDAIAYTNAYFGEHFPTVSNTFCHGTESRLDECLYLIGSCCDGSDTAGVRCQGNLYSDADTHCIEGTVRLAGGEDEHEGRVEICSDGVWGTICGGYQWDSYDANVVCRQLGYQNARVSVYQSLTDQYSTSTGRFGEGYGPTLFVDLACDGTESAVRDCNTGSSQSCSSNYGDAGIRCDHLDSSVIEDCTDGEVRLAGGQNDAEGRVEICIGGIWGSVCDDSWDNRDAAVVCQQLGFQGNNVTVHYNSHFGEGKGPYHLTNVYCYGDEENLLSCSFSTNHNCERNEDAGVTCHEESPCNHGNVRLVDGSMEYEGRVEICDNGRWGTVCDDSYGTLPEIVCRELAGDNSYTSSVTLTYGFPDGSGVPILYNFDCSGAHSRVEDCSYSTADYNGFSSAGCNHNEDIFVRCYVPSYCTTGDVRLVDGGNEMEGRVEMCRDGVWGAITGNHYYDYYYYYYNDHYYNDYYYNDYTYNSWDLTDARVTCRQLGYPSEWAAALSDSYFGRGTSPALFHNILCNGDESSLEECSYSALPLDSYNYYYIYAVVGVICQGNTTSETECSSGDLRLVGGQSESEGRVEVCVDGFWGTVCDQNWSQREAIVACRQAGLPSTGAIPVRGAFFGEGSGPVANFTCTGRDLDLGICTTYLANNCFHDRDAGVVCQAVSGHYTVSVTTNPADGPFHVGDTVTLHCSIDPPPPEGVTYTWTTSVPDVYYTFDNNYYKMFDIPIHHPSEGQYYCHVNDSHTEVPLGVGHVSIHVQGLLYPIGEDIVQYTPPENVTLKVGLTPSPASYYFRLLTWYHDGVELVDGGRITLNDLNTTITMTDTSEDDSGIYEARYNGLLVRPYDRGCERDIIDLLRHYPLLKPVVFHVNTEPSDIYSDPYSLSSAEVSFIGDPGLVPFTQDENIILGIEGSIHGSTEETVMATWYLNGGPLLPGTSLGPLGGPLLSISQELEIPQSNIADSGVYEVALTLNTYTHLISHLQCPYQYRNFVAYTADINNIVLDDAMVHMKYYEPPLVTIEASSEVFTVNDSVNISCTASDGYPPGFSISMTKNGELLAATESDVLYVNTDTVVGTPFGEYICVVNNSVITVEKAILLKEKESLQLKLSVEDIERCSRFDNSTNGILLEESLAAVIEEQCSCDFTTSDLTDSYLMCPLSGNDFTFMTTIVYSSTTGDTTATTLLGMVENWAANTPNPTLAVGMQTAVVEEVCGMEECVTGTVIDEEKESESSSDTPTIASSDTPTIVSSEGPTSDKETQSDSSSNLPTIAGAIGGGIFAGIFLLCILTIIICIILKKRRSPKEPEQPVMSPKAAEALNWMTPHRHYPDAAKFGRVRFSMATGDVQLLPNEASGTMDYPDEALIY